MTLEDLRLICPRSPKALLLTFVDEMNKTFNDFDINTPLRKAAFIAQAAHECMGFTAMREFASGQAYDEGRLAARLGNTPEDDDDGVRYKGRGIFQLTGTDNYRLAGTELWGDPDWLLYHPEEAAEPANACRIAGWYWKRNGLNELADRGDMKTITKRINGGYNGLKDRLDYYNRARAVFG